MLHHVETEDVRELLNLILDRMFEIQQGQRIAIRAIAALHSQGDQIMAISRELQMALDKIDSATTAIGGRVGRIADTIRTGMTQQEVNDVVAKLNAEADKLNTIAADPDNPVPPTVTAPVAGEPGGGAPPSA